MTMSEHHGVDSMQEWPGEVVATLGVDVAVRRPHPFRPDRNRRRLLTDDGNMPEVLWDETVRALCFVTAWIIAVQITADTYPVEEEPLAAGALSVGRS
jgi:hypothetical protein